MFNTLAGINHIVYKSYYIDYENNLYYLMSRYYNPNWGRFISYDSIDYLNANVAGGLNLYAYCLNNPVMYSDPEGTDAIYVVDYTWKDGLPVVGHARLYYQDDSGKWHSTEYTGDFLDWLLGMPVGELININYQSFDEVLTSLSKINCFADCYYISADYSGKEKDYETKYADAYNLKYKLFKNNCLHYVHNCLNDYLYGDDVSKYDTLKTIVPGLYKPKNGVRFDPVVARYIEYSLKNDVIVTNGFSLHTGYSRFIFRQN